MGETLNHQGSHLLPGKNLGLILSMVRVGAYGGPLSQKSCHERCVSSVSVNCLVTSICTFPANWRPNRERRSRVVFFVFFGNGISCWVGFNDMTFTSDDQENNTPNNMSVVVHPL